MAVERSSLVASSPWFGAALGLRVGARTRAQRRSIVAQRRELHVESLGELSYFTNTGERGTRREPALLLIHAPGAGASAHDLHALFEAFREERTLYALDLPGFGDSVCDVESFSPDLCAVAIERVLDVAAAQAEGGVDLVAAGLSGEFAAKVAAQRPDAVRSLTLLDPTGFTSLRTRSALEAAAREGKTLWPLGLLRRLGLGPLVAGALRAQASLRRGPARELSLKGLRQTAGARRPDATRAALACLLGGLFPRENPLAIYTRVHCPTLVVSASHARARFHELPRFVKWRDHFSSLELPQLELTSEHDSAVVAEAMRAFWDGPGRRSRVC